MEQKWGLKKPSDPYSIPKHILRKYLPANPVIIDCGAHVGADSVELAKIFPKASVHSFEPVPTIYNHLKQNTRHYQNITCYQLALNDNNGIAKMYVSSGSSDASSSLLVPTGHLSEHPDIYFDNTIEAKTITLDSWASQNNIKQVDFLWLDMQGAEFNMLTASVDILPTVKAIHAEVSTRETYKGGVLYNDFKKWLEERGFVVSAEAIPSGADMGNVLFVRQ